jgi:DNA-binding NarL/FixJ family response regulator
LMIRVLVVDDHAFVRAGLHGLLDGADGIVVVGECADGSEVARSAKLLAPDVVLMDVQMPLMSGIEAARQLRDEQSKSRVLMITGSVSPGLLDQAASAGAAGYLLKGGDPHQLVEAVRAVAAGGTVWPASVAS